MSSAHAAGLADVTTSLLSDIRKSQQQLDQESRQITRDSEALASELNKESSGLRALRTQAAAVRRQSDEQMVGLATLEERIAAWRGQDTYRQNLLRDFANRHRGGTTDAADASSAVFKNAISRLEAELAPSFKIVDAVTPAGEVIETERLKLGPVQWYLMSDEAGLLYPESDDTLRLAHRFDASTAVAVGRVKNLEIGILPFDPTIDRLLKTRVEPPNLFEQMALGGIWIIPILGFGVLATLIASAKSIQFLRLPKLKPLGPPGLAKANVPIDLPDGPQREIFNIAESALSVEQREDRLFAFLMSERSRLERFLGTIAVTATVSPLLGLLGTVSGMISTFNMMTLFGSGDPSIVSGGISEALVTTELGLIVAIPALIMHALLARKAASYMEGLEASAIALARSDGGDA